MTMRMMMMMATDDDDDACYCLQVADTGKDAGVR